MEVTFRFGKDKEKTKQILKLEKKIEELNKELRDLKLDNGLKELKIEKQQRSIDYYKRRIKGGNEIVAQKDKARVS